MCLESGSQLQGFPCLLAHTVLVDIAVYYLDRPSLPGTAT